MSMYHRSRKPDYLDERNLATHQFDKIKFKVIKPVIKKAFKSPGYLGAQLWDLLLLNTRTAPTSVSFKSKVKGKLANTFNEDCFLLN